MKHKKLEIADGGKAYLKENRALIVIGPGEKYYLIDRHHTMRAAHEEGFRRVYARVAENLSDWSEEEFREEMIKRKWVRLRDESGQARAFGELPRHVKDLKNDRYRSLAWLVRHSGAFRKSSIPFAEFDWADYFRARIQIGPGSAGWDAAVKEAIQLATMAGTDHLPGHKKVSLARKSIRRGECFELYSDLAQLLIR